MIFNLFRDLPPEKDPIYAERVEIVFRHILGGFIPTFAAVLSYAYIIWGTVADLYVIVWLVCILSVILVGQPVLYWQYKRCAPPPEEAEKWIRRFSVLLDTSGVFWGIASIFLLPELISYHLFYALLAAGITAGTVGIYSVFPGMVARFTVLFGSPLFIRFFFYEEPLYLALRIVYPLFWVGMILVGNKIQEAMTTSLKLNIELQEARELLETRVAQRTADLSTANTQLRKLGNAIKYSAEMVVVMDLSGKIEYANPKVTEVCGYTTSELLEMPLEIFQKKGGSPSDDAKSQAIDAKSHGLDGKTDDFGAVLKSVRSGEEWRGEWVLQKKDGGLFITNMAMNPVYDDKHKKITHLVLTMQDISERKQLEEGLLQARKLSGLGTLVSGIAHELNTPLATILGLSEEIDDEVGVEPPIVKQHASWIVQESQRCVTIVRNLLQFSRQHEPKTVPFSLNKVITSVLDLLQYAFKSHSIDLKTELRETSRMVLGDPDRFQQVILNILQNGLQAIRQSELQTIKAAGVPGNTWEGLIEIKTELQRDEVFISIENNGPPIAPKHLGKVFDPFFTTKPVGEGTGLGLSLSHGIIEEHKGRVRVENIQSGGVRFVITLPLSQGSAAEAGEETISGLPLPKGLRILSVEDDMKFGAWLAIFLKREGAIVSQAANGREAIALLANGEIDLIVSDLKMPAMDGMDFYRWLEQEKPAYAGRFVFLSGASEAGFERFCKEKDLPLLLKPVDKKRLIETLRNLSEVMIG